MWKGLMVTIGSVVPEHPGVPPVTNDDVVQLLF